MRSSSGPSLVIRHSVRAGSRLERFDVAPDLSSVVHRDGEVIIHGHCLASRDDLNSLVDKAIRSDDITAVGSAPGCYSVAMVRAGKTTLLTDPVGQFPLFTADAPDGVLIGSRVAGLAAAVGASIDHMTLASRVACPDIPDVFDPHTCFSGIKRIPEGAVTHFGPGPMRQVEHGRIHPVHDIDLREAVTQLRHRLIESVEARTSRPEVLTSDFSGGLDSSSLAFLVARDRPVIGFTSGRKERLDNDDMARVHKYVGLSPAVTNHLVPMSDDHLPYGPHAPNDDEPLSAVSFSGPLRARLAAAAQWNAGIHVVGEGGDVVLGAPPAYLADLARRGELRTLWQHSVMWARLRTRSPARLFRRAMVLGRLGRHRALSSLAQYIERARPAEATTWEDDWIGYWQAPQAHWLTADARMLLASSVHELADRTDDGDGYGDLVTRSWLRLQTMTQRSARLAGAEFGISVHAPFLDTEVVRACLSVPAYRRVDPRTPKPLLRAALAGLVPEVVLSRPTKGNYIKDAYQGVRLAAPRLRKLFDDSAAADLGLLNPGPVRKALDDAIRGLPTPWGALNEVVAVELWLRENLERNTK